MFKLTHGLISTSLINALNYAKCDSTRGHSYKLFINRCNKSVLSNFFLIELHQYGTFYLQTVLAETVYFILRNPLRKLILAVLCYTIKPSFIFLVSFFY